MVIFGAALLLPNVRQIVTQMQALVNIKAAKGTKKLDIANHVT